MLRRVEVVSPAQLEMVVKHGGRLNVLRCLLDGGPLSVSQLAARIGEPAQAVRYWVRLLDSFDLIEEREELNDGQPVYVANLDDQPEWIREAVRHRRPRAF
jgi:DNA-binding transcriptional ArsR family regulator